MEILPTTYQILSFYKKVKSMGKVFGYYINDSVIRMTSNIINLEINDVRYEGHDRRLLQNSSFEVLYSRYSSQNDLTIEYFKGELGRTIEPLSYNIKQFILHQIEMCNLNYRLTDAELNNVNYVKRHLHMFIVVTFDYWYIMPELERDIVSRINLLTNNQMTPYISKITSLSQFTGEIWNVTIYPVGSMREILRLLRFTYDEYLDRRIICRSENIKDKINILLGEVWPFLIKNDHISGVVIKMLNTIYPRVDVLYNPSIIYISKVIDKISLYDIYYDEVRELIHLLCEFNELRLNDRTMNRFHLMD